MRALALLLGLSCLTAQAQTASPTELKDPATILARAKRALSAVKRVRYDLRLKDDAQTTSGTVLRTTSDPLRYRIRTGQLTLGSDGKTHWVLDGARKTAVWSADAEAMAERESAIHLDLLFSFYFDGSVFREAVGNKTLTLSGMTTRGDERCYALTFRVTHEEVTLRTTLELSARDFFPRRLAVAADGFSADAALSKLALDPPVARGGFALKAPEGYRVEELKVAPRPKVGGPAPDWTLASTDGSEVTLSKQRGKIVVMVFWASW